MTRREQIRALCGFILWITTRNYVALVMTDLFLVFFIVDFSKDSWPGERDSNPRRCYPQRFSRPPLSTTQPSPANALKYRSLEATPRFELGNQGFAGPRLTTWLCRHKIVVLEAGLEPARKQYPRDFKSLVSTNSTTRALISHIKNDDLIKI